MKWKPLIASLVVIAVALAVMAIWGGLSGKRGPGVNASANNAPVLNGDQDGGITYKSTPFEELPALDPLGLWPRDGQRMATAEFWVMWETNGRSKCRLLGTGDRRDWYDLGKTSGERHFLQANVASFDSGMTFAVEFEAAGTRYRSTPRTVVFGQGAHFGQRRYKFTLDNSEKQEWDLEIVGRDATQLTGEAFLTVWFPDELSATAYAKSADTVNFQVKAGALKTGCAGFLEVYDARTLTYDRVLIELTR